jgi:hypothetical protein
LAATIFLHPVRQIILTQVRKQGGNCSTHISSEKLSFANNGRISTAGRKTLTNSSFFGAACPGDIEKTEKLTRIY